MTSKWRRFRETDLYCTKEGKVYKNIYGREVGHQESKGYYLISLGGREEGVKKRNRIIAECWITYPNYLPDDMEVHHINGDKSDDRVSNLKVVTRAEHEEIHSNRDYCKKRVVMDDERVFDSVKEANEYLGVYPNGGHIGECCRGERKTFKGHTWKYV